jgi:hypothetical protein
MSVVVSDKDVKNPMTARLNEGVLVSTMVSPCLEQPYWKLVSSACPRSLQLLPMTPMLCECLAPSRDDVHGYAAVAGLRGIRQIS